MSKMMNRKHNITCARKDYFSAFSFVSQHCKNCYSMCICLLKHHRSPGIYGIHYTAIFL